jgi:ABC-2 type transport system ATP-binding protein
MVEIQNLIHIYNGKIKAIDDLTFGVVPGEVVGLLGPNGAGKSTIVKLITGILKATSGSIRVDGLEVSTNLSKIRKKIGFMPQETALYQDLTAVETLEYHGALYGIPKNQISTRIQEMLKLAGLEHRKDDLVKTYSGGMKRRLALVRSIMHDSQLLILDEMSLGVDVQSRNLIWEQVRKMKSEGRTVIFCTNYMDEASALADRLIVIDQGKIIAEGSPDELIRNHLGEFIIEVNLGNVAGSMDATWFEDRLSLKIKAVQSYDDETVSVWIQTSDGTRDLPAVITNLVDAGLDVKQTSMRSPSLGDVFLTLTGSKLRD